MEKVFNTYANRKGVSLDSLRFLFEGDRCVFLGGGFCSPLLRRRDRTVVEEWSRALATTGTLAVSSIHEVEGKGGEEPRTHPFFLMT